MKEELAWNNSIAAPFSALPGSGAAEAQQINLAKGNLLSLTRSPFTNHRLSIPCPLKRLRDHIHQPRGSQAARSSFQPELEASLCFGRADIPQIQIFLLLLLLLASRIPRRWGWAPKNIPENHPGECSPCSLGCPSAPQPWQGSGCSQGVFASVFASVSLPPSLSEAELSAPFPKAFLVPPGAAAPPGGAQHGRIWEQPCQDPQQRRDLLLDKWAPGIPSSRSPPPEPGRLKGCLHYPRGSGELQQLCSASGEGGLFFFF